MAKLKEIVSFLDEYLAINEVKDTSWNGLQFQGKEEVKKIVCLVDAGIEPFKIAIDKKADLIIVHHGHFWKGANPSIVNETKERIDLLYKNNVSLYVSHLPLDRHKEIGNNALLLKLLNAKIKEEFLFEEGINISYIGETEKEWSISEIESILKEKLKAKPIVLPFGKAKIKRIAVCSGGGSYADFFEALSKKADIFITGDSSDYYQTAKDSKINVIFAGHHATEIIGVSALSVLLRNKFKIESEFIDIPTCL
ncbi:Nif3-like dinuclear metal center hexameric protein [Candidatus Woesearchaeota archaeon]|nr:Nif3-like dinuclear metal center hexameric protein [Candidatus Woesearchaeota archaeon]